MTTLTLFEFFRNTIKNMLIALFLAILCLMITVMYSMASYEYGKFAPFKNLDINGYFLGMTMIFDTSDEDEYLSSIKVENYKDVEEVYSVSAGSLFVDDSGVTAYSYDRWIWENWRARLKSGRWFTESGIDSEELEIVLGGDTSQYSVGSKMTMLGKDGNIVLRVIGILQDDTEIMYKDGYNYYETNYEGMYTVPEVGEGQIFAIMQSEAAEKRGISLYNPCEWVIWKYSDKLSDEEADALTREINIKVSGMGKTYSDFVDESAVIARQKVMTYLPTIIISILLVLTALYCIAYVNVQNGSRYYSIYYLVGASKRQCNIIAISYMITTIVLSVIMYIMLGMGFETYARAHNIMYSFVTGPKLMSAGLYLVFAIFLSVCLYAAMRKRSPLDMLRNQKK